MSRTSLLAFATACLFPISLFISNAVIAAELPGDIGPNLAFGKSYESSDPNKSNWGDGLTDGDWTPVRTKTYATGNTKKFPKTVTIDLEKIETVAHVHVGVPNIGSTKTIEVSLSADGVAFTPAGTHDFEMEKAGSHLYAFAPAKARYVRLTFVANHDRMSAATKAFPTAYCFVAEAEVYGPRGSGKTAGVPGGGTAADMKLVRDLKQLAQEQAAAITEKLPANLGPNLALGKPYTCSDTNKNENWAAGLNDGYWLMNSNHTFATGPGKTFPKTVTIDLKTSALLTHVHLGAPDFGSTKSVTVSVSYDGQKFTDVGDHDYAFGKAESHLFAFKPTLARHVRLTFTGNHKEKNRYPAEFCFVTEAEVYAQPQ